jgi:hypothetical protein
MHAPDDLASVVEAPADAGPPHGACGAAAPAPAPAGAEEAPPPRGLGGGLGGGRGLGASGGAPRWPVAAPRKERMPAPPPAAHTPAEPRSAAAAAGLFAWAVPCVGGFVCSLLFRSP